MNFNALTAPKFLCASCVLIILLVPVTVLSYTNADSDKVATYGTFIGRATACNVNAQAIDSASHKIGKWMDRSFFGKDKVELMKIFMTSARYHMRRQQQGKSPDSCGTVRKQFKLVNWP